MKISSKFAKTLSVTKEYNETAFNFINQMLSCAPSIDKALSYASCPTTSYEEVGSLYGLDGTWRFVLHTNSKGHINDMMITFTEAPSTNLASADAYSITINGFDESTKLYTNLVTCAKQRINNYRFCAPSCVKLTTEEVKALSKPEILSRTTLSYSGNHSMVKTDSKTTNGKLETMELRYPYNTTSGSEEFCLNSNETVTSFVRV